ncbi:hypothetical protein ETD86_41620 [Nonomuraea turkmeniaca]|uniref:Uncharacterized protein n=1 Tax=Nonomuraea turkmeniaca TaxID=103838 RepID=A0A5S4F1R1_9ACTN|nr:hypothetical protein [Nonomuraea turkmeniaca]TMR09905.1 hypothetical protein ETD86_41620 [Nonomuraea turkmeniaca]
MLIHGTFQTSVPAPVPWFREVPAPGAVVPSLTHRPAGTWLPQRSAAPRTPLPERSKAPRSVGSPTPQAPPRERAEPEPERPPTFGGGMADPCATFHDFRRQPCYSFLNRLAK